MRDKYKTHVEPRMKEIEEWARQGSTNKEICYALNVSEDRWYTYYKNHPELKEIVEKARYKSIAEVKRALYNKAIGFEYEETKTIIKTDAEGNEYMTVETSKKKLQPDTGAMAMFLRNYDKDWRDRDFETSEMKKKELELKENSMEKELWK